MRSYTAELRQRPAPTFAPVPRDVVVQAFSELACSLDGASLEVRGVRSDPDRLDVVVSAERSGLLRRVVRDGFVLWDDGHVTAPDQRWFENTG